MTILLNNLPLELPDGATLSAVLAEHSPYGNEPVLALLNGARLRESHADVELHEGDALLLFPRLIGG